METYEQIVAFARDCIRHSRTATSKEVSEELLRLAKQYQERAAKLDGGKLPKVD
jgi:hypothetical protein